MTFFDGKGLLVWNAPPAQELAHVLMGGQFDFVDLKKLDGANLYGIIDAAYVNDLRSFGFAGWINGWGYHYCNEPGSAEAEANAVVEVMQTIPFDAYTFDLEQECEGHQDIVRIMFNLISEQIDKDAPDMHSNMWGLYCWSNPKGHDEYPWTDLFFAAQSIGMTIRPMDYFRKSVPLDVSWTGGLPIRPLLSLFTGEWKMINVIGKQHMAAWEYTGLERNPWFMQWKPAVGNAVLDPLWNAAGTAYNQGFHAAIIVQWLIRYTKNEISRDELLQQIDHVLGAKE